MALSRCSLIAACRDATKTDISHEPQYPSDISHLCEEAWNGQVCLDCGLVYTAYSLVKSLDTRFAAYADTDFCYN